MSYHVARLIATSVGEHEIAIAIAAGGIHFQWIDKWPDFEPLQKHSGYQLQDLDNWIDLETPTWHCVGFTFGGGRFNYDGGIGEEVADAGWTFQSTRLWHLTIPFWFVAACTLPLPLWRWRHPSPSRETPGLCTKCRYDLRASKDRCPECGTPFLKA